MQMFKTELETLANQGGDMLSKTTDLTPVTKVPKANQKTLKPYFLL